MPSAVEIRSVSKLFGVGAAAFTALKPTTFTIEKNEFFTILGPSGCGKTTLLRLIAGFEYPSTGEIIVDGKNVSGMPPYRRPINTVFQSYALFPHMTVAENIGFGLRMLGRSRSDVGKRVKEMLTLVRMGTMADRRTGQLSGGQQQRVALARALAPEPQVLLLDESLSALDYKLRKEMQLELKALQAATGITFVFVTHDQEEALTMSDRIAVLSSGEVLQIGPPREIYDVPVNRFVADFIGETNFLEGSVVSQEGTAVLVDFGPAGRLVAEAKDASPVSGRVLIVVRPEHATLASHSACSEHHHVRGTILRTVYSGNDTHLRIRLAGSETTFSVRQRNRPLQDSHLVAGQNVSIAIDERAARVLGRAEQP